MVNIAEATPTVADDSGEEKPPLKQEAEEKLQLKQEAKEKLPEPDDGSIISLNKYVE